jgi:hypothetical protein
MSMTTFALLVELALVIFATVMWNLIKLPASLAGRAANLRRLTLRTRLVVATIAVMDQWAIFSLGVWFSGNVYLTILAVDLLAWFVLRRAEQHETWPYASERE